MGRLYFCSFRIRNVDYRQLASGFRLVHIVSHEEDFF